MSRAWRFFIIFSIFYGIFHSVYSENYSVDSFNFHSNKKTEFDTTKVSKENIFENPLQKNINNRRRLLFNEDDSSSATNRERQEGVNDYSARRRSNFTEPINDNWGNVRLQFPFSPNTENSRNFADVSLRPPVVGEKNSNQRFGWEEKGDVFEKSQSRWNEEKNYKEIPDQDLERNRNYYNGRVGGMISDSEMNREDRRDDVFDRRVSITTLHDADMGNIKNHDDRVGSIHSGYTGHSNINYHNRNPHSFWNSKVYKPEKEVVINLKTECSTPRQFNNHLIHRFIFTPKTSLSSHSEFGGFQIPDTGFFSSHKMAPMYYL